MLHAAVDHPTTSGLLPQVASSQVDAVAVTGSDLSSTTPSKRTAPTPAPTKTPVTTTREERVTEVVAFEQATVDDATLPLGQSQVTTPGQNGERTLVYVVTLVDGDEVSRELKSDVITTPPVAQVTANGTYVAPAPAAPAPASDCDPNYADACVPIASDVDCAGGSGDGPAYFDGIARVVGRDIYQLDRDHDGFACEPS